MEKRNKILVFRFSSMGDVAMTVPVITEFLNQHPETEIIYVSRKIFKPLFEDIAGVTFFEADLDHRHKGVIGLYKLAKELNKTGFTQIADLHNVLRTQIIRKFLKNQDCAVLDKARKEREQLVRQQNKIKKQLIPVTERYAMVFRKLGYPFELSNQLKKKENAVENAVGIAPFAMYAGKTYPLDKMRAVALKIAEKGTKVYLFGSKKENETFKDWEKLNPNIISVAGKYNLKQEIEIIGRLKLMVSMDSANMHLASIAGTRVISIWGTTHPFMGFLGYGQSYEDVIQDENIPERPTSVYGKESKNAAKPDYFKNISPEMIIERIEKYL